MGRSVEIRPAVAADAVALAELAARSFRETFADDNEAGNIDSYVRDFFSERRVSAELAEAGNLFLLASDDGAAAACGYAKLREGAADPSVRGPKPVELERIYVEAAAIGTGVGAALMGAALEAAAEGGFETVWLGVWERNSRAIRFYERWGFERVGSHPFRLGAEEQTDLIFERPARLDPTPGAGR